MRPAGFQGSMVLRLHKGLLLAQSSICHETQQCRMYNIMS
jgi:hypothetical protein